MAYEQPARLTDNERDYDRLKPEISHVVSAIGTCVASSNMQITEKFLTVRAVYQQCSIDGAERIR